MSRRRRVGGPPVLLKKQPPETLPLVKPGKGKAVGLQDRTFPGSIRALQNATGILLNQGPSAGGPIAADDMAELGYVSYNTANQTITSTASFTDLTNLDLTVNPAGKTIYLMALLPDLNNGSGSTRRIYVRIFDVTNNATRAQIPFDIINGDNKPVFIYARVAGLTGNTEFKVQGQVDNALGVAIIVGGATVNTFSILSVN